MERVVTTSRLEAPAEVVWRGVRRVELLLEIVRPLLVMSVPEGTPDRWSLDTQVAMTSRLLGVVPIGTQVARFVELDDDAMRARTEESGGLVEQWHHTITVTADGPDACTYVDDVSIDAGPATPLVVWFARRLYAHRHRRLRRLAPLLAAAR